MQSAIDWTHESLNELKLRPEQFACTCSTSCFIW